jgi:hypothetical protein
MAQKENIFPSILDKVLTSHVNSNEALLGKFENSLLILKLFILLVLIIASVINKDLSFGKNISLTDSKYSVRFVIETIVVGIGCALPFVYMKWMRDSNNATIFNLSVLFIFSFIFMALLNILFQFSGLYSYIFGIASIPESKDNIKKGLIRSVLLSNIIIIGLIVLQILYISLVVGNTDIPAYTDNFIMLFGFELLIFAISNTLPTLLITIDRIGFFNNSIIFTILTSMIVFSILHTSFQMSGFYKHLLGI